MAKHSYFFSAKTINWIDGWTYLESDNKWQKFTITEVVPEDPLALAQLRSEVVTANVAETGRLNQIRQARISRFGNDVDTRMPKEISVLSDSLPSAGDIDGLYGLVAELFHPRAMMAFIYSVTNAGNPTEYDNPLFTDMSEEQRTDIANRLGRVFLGDGVNITDDIPVDWIKGFINSNAVTNIEAGRNEIIANAQTSIAWRYALRELNPFVVEDLDYSQHNEDKSLELYNPETGVGMTDKWIEMRAMFLAFDRSYRKTNDDDGVYNLVTGIPTFIGDTYFVDRVNGETYELKVNDADFDLLDAKRIAFGGDEAEIFNGEAGKDTLFGGGGNDRLRGFADEDYLEGGRGADTLEGGADDDTLIGSNSKEWDDNAQDTLEGGAGFDTYYAGSSDIIRDSDGKGVIHFGETTTITSSGGLSVSTTTTANMPGAAVLREGETDVYDSVDGAYVYTLNGNTLNVQHVQSKKSITIEGFPTEPNTKHLGIVLIKPPSEATQVNPYVVASSDFENGIFLPRLSADFSEFLPGGPFNPYVENYVNYNDVFTSFNLDSRSINYDITMLDAVHQAENGRLFAETVWGSRENDRLIGGDYRQTFLGRDGDDYIQVGGGQTPGRNAGSGISIFAAQYRFTITNSSTAFGGAGSDHIVGHEGTYNLLFGGNSGGGLITGPEYNIPDGEHTVDFLNHIAYSSSYSELVDGGDAEVDAQDFLEGQDLTDFLSGQEGNDVLLARGGSDHLAGGAGSDVLLAGEGNDVVFGDGYLFAIDLPGDLTPVDTTSPIYALLDKEDGVHSYDDYIDGGEDNDLLIGGLGNDKIYGGIGNDDLYGDRWELGDDNAVPFEIQKGENTSQYGHMAGRYIALDESLHGNDTLFGGAGKDRIFGHGGDDKLFGESGIDYLYSGSGKDILEGGTGDDRLYAESGENILRGGQDSDVYFLQDGINRIEDNHGNNVYISEGGENSYYLGQGTHVLLFSAGQNVVKSGGDFVIPPKKSISHK